MVYLDKKEDYANYDVYTNYGKAFEKKGAKNNPATLHM